MMIGNKDNARKSASPAQQQKHLQTISGRFLNSLKPMASWTKVLLRNDSGGSLVEMAVVLPVMMLLITGTCSLGVILNNDLVLTNAVQTGAMQVAISAGQSNLDPCSMAATAVVAAAPTLRAANITYSFNFNGTAAGPFTGTAASTCASDNQYLTAGTTMSVTATYPTELIIFGWRPSTLTLRTMTAELAQ